MPYIFSINVNNSKRILQKMKLIYSLTLLLLNLSLVAVSCIRVKKTAKAPFSLLNIPDNLPVEDLHEGLRALTTGELKTLSKYIDDQSKRQTESHQNKRQVQNDQNKKNLLGAMENYWTRHVQAAIGKKKRSIDDLYEEMAHENAEPQENNDVNNENNDEWSEMEALGCTCRNVPNEWNIKNMRTKRENQYAANVEKGYSIEEYVRDLENSFPRDQDEKEQFEGETAHKNHLRIKRL